MRLRHAVRSLLAVAALAGPVAGADALPAPWVRDAALAGAGVAVRSAGGVVQAEGRSDDPWRIERPLDGVVGSDEAPLVVRATLGISGRRAMARHHTVLLLRWADGAQVAVGLPPAEQVARERNAWAGWRAEGRSGEAAGRQPFQVGEADGHLRLVLTSRLIVAESSRHGVVWERVLELPRQGALVAAPAALAVGRGLAAEAGPRPAPARKDDAGSWRFAGLAAEELPAQTASALLKDYRRPDSYEAVREADEDRGVVRRWRVRAPLERPAREAAAAAAEADPAGEAWSDVELPAGKDGRVLDLARGQSPARPQVQYLAACRIAVAAPRYELLRCEGTRQVQLLVNGREVARTQGDDGSRKWFRLAVAVPLQAGDNLVVARVSADERGAAILSLRHGPADPRARIAWLGRIALDFPAEAEAQVDGRREIARLWEDAGQLHAAADTLGELAAVADLPAEEVDRAQTERARLLHRLDDQAGVTALVKALEQRWAEAGGGSAARLTAARLWDGLGRSGEAVAALSAVIDDPATEADERRELALERVRLAERISPAAAAEACTAAAALMPDTGRRTLLQAEAARRDPACAAAATPSLRLAGAVAAEQRPAALERAAAAQPLSIAAPLRAEELAASEPARALTLYRAALAAAGGSAPATADLPALRRALFLAQLATSAPGRVLAAAGAAAGPAASAAGGDIIDWQVCGPLPADATLAKPPCDPADPTAAAVAGKAWKRVQLPKGGSGVLELIKAVGDSREAALCSAVVTASAATDAVLFCGSDDGLVLWLNGERVFEDLGLRGVVRDQFAVPVRLKAGANRVLAVVHNAGGGEWGLQLRTQVGSFPGGAVSALTAMIGDPADVRAVAADAGRTLVDQLVRANRLPEAAALATALGRALPDQASRLAAAAAQVLAAAPDGAGRCRLEVVRWCEEVDDLGLQPSPLAGDWRLTASERLLADGDAEAGLDLLRRGLAGEFRRDQRAALFTALGAALVRHGVGGPARRQLAAARDLAPGDAGLRDRLGQLQAVVRSWQGEWPRIDSGHELIGRIDAADRAAAGDPVQGAEALGRLIEERGERLWAVGERTWQPTAWWAQRRMAEAAPALLAAWRAAAGERADAAFAVAPAAARERLAARWPFAAAAAPALLDLAEDQLDRDQRSLAVATAEQALGLPGAAGDATLALRALRVAVLGGDAAAVARLRPACERAAGEVVIQGKAVPAAQALAAVLALPALPVVATAPAATALPRRAAWIAQWQPSPVELRQLAAAGEPARAAVLPAVVPAGVLLALGDGVALLDAASGALRWRSTVAAGGVPPPFAGAPDRSAVQVGAMVAARVQADGRWRLQGCRAADGRPRWSSADLPALAALEAVSDPAVCGDALVLVMAGRATLHAAVLDGASGALRQLLDLPGSRQQPGGGGWEAPALTGHLPAPLVDGRTAFIDTGGGLLAAVDVPAGRLRWVSAYPRTVVGEGSRNGAAALLRRAASVPVRQGRLVVAAPRDSLALAAFDALSGLPAWRRDLVEAARVLPAGGDALLLQGEGLELADAATGATRWRWRPAAGAALGTPALARDVVLVASAAGLHRLRLADGVEDGTRSWRDLGLDEPATNLVLAGGRLLACGRSALAALAAEAPAAIPRIVVPAPVAVAAEAQSAPLKPGETTFAAAWYRPGPRIDEVVAAGDDCLVRSEGALLRLRLADGAQRWRVAIPAGAAAVLDPALVVVYHRGWYAHIDASTGALLAHGQTDPDPTALFEEDSFRVLRAGDGWLTALRPNWNQTVLATRLADGRTTRLAGLAFPMAATMAGGQLRVLAAQDNRVSLRDYDPLTGVLEGSLTLGDGFYERVAQWPQRRRWCLGQRGRTYDLFDLEARTRTRLDLGEKGKRDLHGMWTWLDGERLGLGLRNSWDTGQGGTLDPATGALDLRPIARFDAHNNNLRLTYRVVGFADGMVVACERELPGKGWRSGVVASAPDGKERWFWALDGDHHRRKVAAVLPWQDRLVVVSRGGDERLHWHALDAAGKEQGNGPLPGWISGQAGCTTQIGGRWLLGTSEGLVCLARCGGGGVAAQPGVPVPVVETADPAALSGDIPLVGDAGATLRLGSSAVGLVLSVAVPGGGAGDELLVGADVLGGQGQRAGSEQPPVWRIVLDDGRTRCVRSGGAEVDAVSARAAWSPAGMRFEVVLPWPAIVGEAAAQRPAGLGLGVAVRSGARSAELGRGLLGGLAPHAWAVVEWQAAPKPKAKGK
jgi:hypothetical protein